MQRDLHRLVLAYKWNADKLTRLHTVFKERKKSALIFFIILILFIPSLKYRWSAGLQRQ